MDKDQAIILITTLLDSWKVQYSNTATYNQYLTRFEDAIDYIEQKIK